jgi:hypothetical protein
MHFAAMTIAQRSVARHHRLRAEAVIDADLEQVDVLGQSLNFSRSSVRSRTVLVPRSM